jgi:hypothetical protein
MKGVQGRDRLCSRVAVLVHPMHLPTLHMVSVHVLVELLVCAVWHHLLAVHHALTTHHTLTIPEAALVSY